MPKILRNELPKPKIVYSTEEEQLENEKIDNLTIPEIKIKISDLLDRFTNKSIWMELHKNEVAGKPKAFLVEFCNSINEVLEEE